MRPLPAILALLGLLAPVLSASAQSETKLIPSDGLQEERFGSAVAVSGDAALVGSPRDGFPLFDAGSVYAFRRSGGTWTQQARLTASDPAEDTFFGDALALDGDVALVGAYKRDGVADQVGAAYVFRYAAGTWGQEAKLTPSDGQFLNWFGSAVAIEGDVALIGAENDNDNGRTSGSAYVFRRIGGVWTEEAKLLPLDGAAEEQFGTAVALVGDLALVGADQDGDLDFGAAYVFRREGNGWTQEAKLTASDGAFNDFFGTSVALGADGNGTFAVVGARQDDSGGPGSGAAYVFRRSGTTWTEEAQLLPPDTSGDAYFGGSVSADGGRVLIGAARTDVSGENSGAAYLFERVSGTWTQQARLTPSDGSANDWFGVAVALDGPTALVGAFLDDPRGMDSGSAYVYSVEAPVVVDAGPVGGPVTIPTGGGVFQFTVTLTNTTAQPQAFHAWAEVSGPVSRSPVRGPQTVTLPAGATVTRTLTQQVPGAAPAGTYAYAVNVGSFPGVVLASDGFSFTKQSGAAPRVGGAPGDWATAGWEAAASSASAMPPGGFALSEATPNPFGGRAQLRLELAKAEAVRAEVFDGLGRRVAVLHDGAMEAGAHTLAFDGSSLPAGLYVVRVPGETFAATRRSVLAR